MILTKSELLDSLQKEVRILLHLASKIDRAQLDYRPTPKQRSTLELLQYLTYMGPMLLRYAKGEKMDADAWTPIVQAAGARDFDQTLAAIEAHQDTYAALVGDMEERAFRAEVPAFDGTKTTCGAFIVNHVLVPVRRVSHAVVHVPEGLRPRGIEHRQSLGRRRSGRRGVGEWSSGSTPRCRCSSGRLASCAACSPTFRRPGRTPWRGRTPGARSTSSAI